MRLSDSETVSGPMVLEPQDVSMPSLIFPLLALTSILILSHFAGAFGKS